MSDDHEVIEKQIVLIDGLVKSLTPDRVSLTASSTSKEFMLSPTSTNVRSTKKINLKLADTLAKIHEAIGE